MVNGLIMNKIVELTGLRKPHKVGIVTYLGAGDALDGEGVNMI